MFRSFIKDGKECRNVVFFWTLKGQCQEIFDHFFCFKIFHLGPNWTGKTGFVNFFVFAKIFAKNECLRSQRLCGHTWNYFSSEKEKTNNKSNKKFNLYFQKCCVRVVVDYMDTSMTTRTLFGNFEGLQILKEQSGKKKVYYLDVFSHPIAKI